MKRTTLIFVISLLVVPLTTFANNEQTTLKRITHKIASIKNSLTLDHNKRNKLQGDLKKVETNSSRISKRLYKTKKNLREQQDLLQSLKTNQEKYESQLKTEQTLLEQQILTAYMLGRQSYLKLLLNQENSSQVSRFLMYYHYINESRLQVILNIQDTLEQIQNNQEAIEKQYNVLKTLQVKQKTQKQQLAEEQKNRLHLLSILNKNIQSKQQRLDTLNKNKTRLKKMIERIAQAKVNFPKANFTKLHKRLHWPTNGKVVPLFGTQIEKSELRWGGVLIKAKEGQPIHAIADGKVVFAKWLQGYGLLLIVNHGNGFMTLYGRNHVLYKKVGDVVHPGDLIASVGQTGGYKSPALYFEIRHNGKPVNPALFMK